MKHLKKFNENVAEKYLQMDKIPDTQKTEYPF